jgi:putative ABC transport system permease protein
MDSWRQDLIYGIRKLLRAPGFTLISVLTLALGIGVTTAMFNLINLLLLRPYGYQDPEQLVVVKNANQEREIEDSDLSFVDLVELQRRSSSFQEIGGYEKEHFNVGQGDQALWVKGARASAGLFRALRGRMILGRGFLPEEDQAGGPRAVVLSETLWRSHFAAAPGVLDTRILVDGEPHTVVGVVANEGQMPDPNEAILFVPIAQQLDPGDLGLRRKRTFHTVARLRPGTTAEQASAELRRIGGDLAGLYPDTHDGWRTSALPLREYRSRELGGLLARLFAVAGFVLLIACVNVATLLLQRGADRQRELAVRMSLGADRSRLTRQLLTENTVLSMVAAGAGLIVGYWIFRLTINAIPDGEIETYLTRFVVDLRLLGFLVGVVVVTVLLFGLAPALILSQNNLAAPIKENGGKSSAGVARRRLRNGLIVTEVALSILALTAAGLMARSFLQLVHVEPGFDPRGILTMKVALPEEQYSAKEQRVAFYRELQRRIETLPGVRSAAAGRERPLADWSRTMISLERQSEEEAKNNPSIYFQLVNGDYLETIGQRLLQGRAFDSRDSLPTPRVALVSQAAAEHFWPGQVPVGQRFRASPVLIGSESWVTVVGVVANTLHDGLRSSAQLDIYLPYEQTAYGNLELFVRTDGDPLALIEPIRREIRALDAHLPSDDTSTMEDTLAESLWTERMSLILLCVFGALALVMAGVGLYGSLAYSVTGRTNEIGIRMALGAKPIDVLKMVLREASLLVAAGLIIGLGLSLLAGRALASLLFQVSTYDVATYAIVTVTTTLVALIASGLPARRAAQIPPKEALRYE